MLTFHISEADLYMTFYEEYSMYLSFGSQFGNARARAGHTRSTT